MDVVIRTESPGDESEIESVTKAAFEDVPYSAQTEHHIVNALREAGQMTVSLVAEIDGDIVGHIAVSPVRVSDGSKDWYGLGPISVWPGCQGRGIGSRLMQQALQQLQAAGAAGCVLLGEPQFYSRFGFRPDATLVLPGVPAEYFQALSFTSSLPSGEVSYHPAFS